MGTKYLSILVLSGALMLSACGEDEAKQPQAKSKAPQVKQEPQKTTSKIEEQLNKFRSIDKRFMNPRLRHGQLKREISLFYRDNRDKLTPDQRKEVIEMGRRWTRMIHKLNLQFWLEDFKKAPEDLSELRPGTKKAYMDRIESIAKQPHLKQYYNELPKSDKRVIINLAKRLKEDLGQ